MNGKFSKDFERLDELFKDGAMSPAEKLEFEEQLKLLERNYDRLLRDHLGMWVAYVGGAEYMAESDAELRDQIAFDDPKRTRKIVSAEIR